MQNIRNIKHVDFWGGGHFGSSWPKNLTLDYFITKSVNIPCENTLFISPWYLRAQFNIK